MNKNIKRLAAAALVSLTLLAVGCGVATGSDRLHALTTGIIDCRFKGEVTQSYLDLANINSDSAVTEYNTNITDEARYLVYVYCYNTNMNDELKEQYAEPFRSLLVQMFKNFKYSTDKGALIDENTYSIDFTFKPFALGDAIDEVVMPYYEANQLPESYANELLKSHDDALFPQIQTAMENYVKNMKYKDSVTITIKLHRNENDTWDIDPLDYYDFLEKLIDYNLQF